MPLFSRRIPYDRKRLLREADSLREGRRWRRALKLYRQILAAEPHNAEIHFRAAPLLARSGRPAEAWESFRIAAEGLTGDDASLLALRQQAVKSLPRSFDACRALARTWVRHQQPDRAGRTLCEGSRRLRRRATRGQAIVLLRDARELDPWNPAVLLELCRLLARDGYPAEALFLLDHLDERVSTEEQRAVRALAWRIEPSLRHTWRWLRGGRGTGQPTRVREARRAA